MEEQIVHLLQTIEGAATTLAPQVWSALLVHARVSSILCLVFSVITLPVAAVTLRRLPKLWEKACENDAEPIVVVGGLIGAILTIFAVVLLFDTGTWLGVFYPEAVVVHDLLSSKN